MAGKKVQEKVVEVGGEKDSFSKALEQAQPVFMEGHPAAGGQETEDALLKRKAKEKEDEDGKERKRPSEKETPEEEDEIEDDEKRISKPKDEPEEKEEEEGEKKPRRRKFDTLEDADQALREAERKMHEATTETAELRRSMSTLQEQLNTLLIAQVEGKKEKDLAEKDLQSKETKKKQRDAIREMLKVTRNLDPEDEQYDEKYAEAMAALFDRQEEELRSRMRDELKAEIVKEVKPADSNEKDLWSAAVRFAKAKGLDMNPEAEIDDDGNPVPSTDYELFERVIYTAPGKTFKEQVENAVNAVNRLKKKIQSPLLKARKPKDDDRERETETEILERGGGGREERSERPIKPMSISEALDRAARQRTI